MIKSELEWMREEIRQLKEQISEYEHLIKDISAPIIPSVVPDTILVPITGRLSTDRFHIIVQKILDTVHTKQVGTVIIDFTAITEKEAGEIEVLGRNIEKLISSLGLMGVQVIFVGFSPSITRVLVKSKLTVLGELKTFLSFRSALQFLMKQKGLKFESII
ncbi:STAS domain-containing protein [Heyndrickxia acidicola]|uniref:STAS domain-containing protein n=1 Tax=Heyndrickxia acidicola TaxID=209389 RepID=A0ABU6MIW6_9BACI|nr:STAS domain-containing protein [Heyndrickxia acidicola]MED1204611.1 STAS domain-containing protein [Heyndrickxia acidicola]